MIDEKIATYAETHSTSEDKLLYRLNRETHLKTIYPRMLSGHYQGKILEMISHMIQPKRILEIGTFTGYSAINLGRGLAEDGLLHTIEVNPELQEIFNDYFSEAGLADKIKVHIGEALKIIPEIKEIFDLVFIDADKENYLAYYKLSKAKLRKGGFILVDNTLWSGKVLQKDEDKETEGIIEFNEYVQQDEEVENVLLTVRDGLMLVRKL